MASIKILCLHLLTLTTVLVLLQASQTAEGKKKKKIKKIVKDAAKLSKKYGYLLASRKKKLYAIPFPMPLPVFIKRQQIYTQIPIIPRYVQHPQPYGAPAHQSDSSYEPMASYSQTAPSFMEMSTSEGHDGQRQRGKKGASAQAKYESSSSASSKKYLNQLASIIGQSVPVFGQSSGKSNRDLMNKLLNGQAKILPPSSLISAIKGPSSALLKYQKLQQQQESDQAKDQEQDSKHESSASSAGHKQSSTGETTKTPYETSSTAADSNRPSASEVHRTRFRPLAPMVRGPSDLRRIPLGPMLQTNPMMSPLAVAMATAQQVPGLVGRVPMSQLAAANQYLALLDSAQANQLDKLESQSSEPNVLLAGQQPNSAAGADEQSNGEEQNQQLIEHRRQQLLKLALLKERQEAERLLEARLILARAKQLGQQASKQPPVSQQLAAQLINHYRQQQIGQQLQQMRFIQLLQQQQQLQQNSIDN